LAGNLRDKKTALKIGVRVDVDTTGESHGQPGRKWPREAKAKAKGKQTNKHAG
jgi:hypothetical protein